MSMRKSKKITARRIAAGLVCAFTRNESGRLTGITVFTSGRPASIRVTPVLEAFLRAEFSSRRPPAQALQGAA